MYCLQVTNTERRFRLRRCMMEELAELESISEHRVKEESPYPPPPPEDMFSETHPPGSQRNGKLFLGGLSQDTTAADIQAYFKDFGVVKESFIKMDALTGRSRGFGFVIFVDPCCTDAVFKTLPHLVKGKQLDIKAAVPKHLTKDRGLGSRKVFVGGLSQMVTEDFLRFYFDSKFGEVSEVKIMFDHSTPKPHRHRGFAFVTFASFEDGARVVAALNGHQYEKNGFKPLKVSFKTKKVERGGGGGATAERKATPLIQSAISTPSF